MTPYDKIIMNLFKSPINKIEDNSLEFYENPSCGDKVAFKINVHENILNVSYNAVGCAVGTASASIMSEYLTGKEMETVKKEIQDFLDNLNTDIVYKNESLQALNSLKQYPVRIKCVTLCWFSLLDELLKNNYIL